MLYEKSRTKQKSFKSYFGFGKSNRKASISNSAVEASETAAVTTSQSHIMGSSPAMEAFNRAHEAEEQQARLVEDLAAKVDEFKRKRQTLSDAAAGSNVSWNRLRQMVEETISGRVELSEAIDEVMEKLDYAESAYNSAKKKATDLVRARLVVQHAHHYFTRALKICDELRGTSSGRAFVGALGGGGGMNDMMKKIQYGDSVKMASKAQICLNEMFRVMEPYEQMLPADRMEDYKALQKMGLMQMSKIYNLMWGGSIMAHGVAGSIKLLLERQEAAFAYLTPLAVWIQNKAPECLDEADVAERLRDDVRREVATTWNDNIRDQA